MLLSRFILCIIISIFAIVAPSNTMYFNPTDFKPYINEVDLLDFEHQEKFTHPLPEYLEQALCVAPNTIKFALAKAILQKSALTYTPQIRSQLTQVIASSFQPLELYSNKTITFDMWDQWRNVQEKDPEKLFKLSSKDIAMLFQAYTLPKSLEYYTKLNNLLYFTNITSANPRFINKEILVDKLQLLELKLAKLLKQELQEYYGIELSFEHMPEPYNCTFKITLLITEKSEQKLKAYIEQQLKE